VTSEEEMEIKRKKLKRENYKKAVLHGKSAVIAAEWVNRGIGPVTKRMKAKRSKHH